MDETFQSRIAKLEQNGDLLDSKVSDLSNNTEEKARVPYTKTGGNKDQSHQKSVDGSTGLNDIYAGSPIWNDVELRCPPFGENLSTTPIKGYNRHSHSRFSGGALDINTLEIVEFDINWDTNPTHSKHCQSLWRDMPPIKTSQNSKNENVLHVGKLDLIFNADSLKWGTTAYEIDVEKCYFVLHDADGNIEVDDKGNEMKALLYDGPESSKSNLIWDSSAKCWRFVAVYAEEPEV